MNSKDKFEEFIEQGTIKKVSVDKERSKSLVIESERKMNSLKEQIEKIGVRDNNANDYLEYCYDIIMFLIRSKLYLEGYSSSGLGAHEAEVFYLTRLGFTESDVRFADQLRYFRNGILYYGKRLDKNYAKKVIEFTKKSYPKLREIINKNLK
ncbi:hypothetical protein CL617_02930 [archaeon]|nr:hypothetical protein [archaeon]|tara:strand:+ start:4784 stop:5239 length:456 start_codon:yes stop_codon:yes gene_type:complete